jgi:hypothetical protein
MKLPAQSRSASRRFNEAVAYVQCGLGRKIVFLPLKLSHDSLLTNNVGGYHESADGEERIWLDSDLPYMAMEATAAHELAHIVQLKEGYPRVSSIRGDDGQPLIPTLEHLAARARNLVMDESADLWAIARGFDMGKALGDIGLNRLLRQLDHKAVEREAAAWDAYFAELDELARLLKAGKLVKAVEIPAEVETQVMTLDYAGLSSRLARYGLFGGLDEAWQQHWPVSRAMGKELAEIVRLNGVENAANCREALNKTVAFLKIPAPLISIG